jgi:telomere length regulation protein
LIENFVKELMLSMILQQNEHIRFNRLLEHMPKLEQRNVLFSLVKIVSKDYLSSSLAIEDNSRWWQSDASMISAVAALIKLLVDGEESHKGHFIFWLTNSSGGGIGDGIAIRRAIVASLALDKVNMESILEKSLRQFGDQLYIRHTPTLQQEGMCSVINIQAKLTN